MQLAIFEDQRYENFYPLSLIRPIYELKCGQTMLHEKIVRTIKADKLAYFARDYLTDVIKQRNPGVSVNDVQALKGDDVLLVNGSWLFIEGANVSANGDDEIGLCEQDGTVLYIRAQKSTVDNCSDSSFEELLADLTKKITRKKEIKATVMAYWWDLMYNNIKAVVDDFKFAGKSGIKGEFHSSAVVLGDKSQLYVSPGAEVFPCAVIDVRQGPVTIEEGSLVHPGSFINGPTYIGPRCKILGARVREGTMLGPDCWVGGEIEECVIHGYLNKMHDSFLGHSYVGEGVNLGALFSNSDMKNDFSSVSVYVKGEFIDSGGLKTGAVIGDHTKTGIGTLVNTGSNIGLMSIILGGDGVLPKYLPSFSWYINSKITKGFGFGKALSAAMMQIERRGRKFSEAEIAVIKEAYKIAKPERDVFVKKDRMN